MSDRAMALIVAWADEQITDDEYERETLIHYGVGAIADGSLGKIEPWLQRTLAHALRGGRLRRLSDGRLVPRDG